MLMEGVRPAAHARLRPSSVRFVRLVLGLTLVAAYLWIAGPAHVPNVAAAGTCTGWTSNVTPPTSIRVLRTSGPAAGSVQTVDFRSYVKTVIAAEWSPGPVDAMRVGAVAVKQYAWYWTMVWRGKKAADGSCYDVVDTTTDQLYRPERDTPAASLVDAIDATWSISLRKGGRLFASGYRTGGSAGCGGDADGWILYQASLYKCARAGQTFDQLLHRYLDPVEIVRPGVGDSTGDGLGDVVVVTSGGEVTNVRLYGAGKVTPPPTVVTSALGVPVALPIAPARTIFRAVADVTGDRLDDIVLLQRLDDGHYQIWVAASVGDGFAPPTLWWESALSNVEFAPTALVRFAAGDFTGDGKPDAALLVASDGTVQPPPPPTPTPTPTTTPTPTETPIPSFVIGAPITTSDPTATTAPTSTPTVPPTPTPTPTPLPTGPTTWPASATLWLLPGNGTTLGPATPVWSGPLELNGTAIFAGDADGDGRADLIVQEDVTKQPGGGTGLRYAVLRTGRASGAAPETWLELPSLAASGAKTVAADLNRDGRMDLVVDRALGSSGSQIDGLLSNGSAFTTRTLWKNAGAFRWSASRLASADVDGDGRGDLVVLYNAGTAGSRLYRFVSTGTALKSAGATTDPTLVWTGAAPY
jgi:hypothetical protein